MRYLTHQTTTAIILFAAFFVGYSYARLSRDEFLRREMYVRHSNCMLVFDGFKEWFGPRYGWVKQRLISFDQTYEFWRMRQLKWQEWKESRRRQEEIYQKNAENDQLS